MPALIFDFDSTLVSVEGLDELFARSLEGSADRHERTRAFNEITDLGMAGEISAEESLARRLGVLQADRGLVAAVGRSIGERITPSVLRHLAFFEREAGNVFVVSGGFEELISPALRVMGIPDERLRAHRFTYDDAERVTGMDPDTPVARGGKPEAVRSLGIVDGPVWVVGDGATDLDLRTEGLADLFVAFTENRRRDPIVNRADAVVGSMDELLTLWENR